MEWLVLGWGVVGELVPLTPASNLGYAFLGVGGPILAVWGAHRWRQRCARRAGREVSLPELIGGER